MPSGPMTPGPLTLLANSPRKSESTRCFCSLWVSPSLARQAAGLFCFHKPYYVSSGTVTLSQLRGHNRKGGEEQRDGERMKKEQEGRKRRKRGQREGRVETEGDHLIFTACSCGSWSPVTAYATCKVLPPLILAAARGLLPFTTCAGSPTASCLQVSPQGPLVSPLEAAAAGTVRH